MKQQLPGDSVTYKTNRKKKNAGKQIAVAALSAASVLLIALIAFVGVLHYNLYISDDPNIPYLDEREEDDKEKTIIKDHNRIIEANSSTEGVDSIIKNWALAGGDKSLLKSKSVINYLLIGVDAGGGNADVLMLVSLNKDTEKIYLTSIMRDSYTYIATENGDVFTKINASYSYGGAECAVKTIEDDYKIQIDGYVSVSYQSFSEIVDAIGGIDLPVQRYEAIATGVIWEWGDNVHLNGAQALEFCRIRNCDSDGDVSRTRRQRSFINAVIQKTKTVSVSQLADVLKIILQYVKTDRSLGQLISLGTQAISGKWYNYEMIQNSIPLEEYRMPYSGLSWVWIVDYPGGAQALQKMIYGESGIQLASNRYTAIQAAQNGNF